MSTHNIILGLLLMGTVSMSALANLSLPTNDNLELNKKEINRRSIVFDIKTPKVFYCPQEKQLDVSKMLVKARPLENLCQFEGKQKPKDSPTDCFNDVDETSFACDEKRRFLVSTIF